MSDHLPQHPDDPTAAALSRIEQLLCGISDLQRKALEPAQVRVVTFRPGEAIHRDEHGPRALSIAVINPNPMSVYLAVDGGRAGPSSNAIKVNPKTALVLPVTVDRLEMAVTEAELGGETSSVTLLRFAAIQPFFSGAA